MLSSTSSGMVAMAPNDTTKFLRGDATWAAIPNATYVDQSNIKLLLHFDSSGNILLDSSSDIKSGYSAGGTAPSFTSNGKFSGSVHMVGGHDSSPNLFYFKPTVNSTFEVQNNNFTFSYFYKLNVVNGQQVQPRVATPFFALGYDYGRTFVVKDVNGTTLINENIDVGATDTNWHHISINRDGSYLRVYKDGVAIKTYNIGSVSLAYDNTLSYPYEVTKAVLFMQPSMYAWTVGSPSWEVDEVALSIGQSIVPPPGGASIPFGSSADGLMSYADKRNLDLLSTSLTSTSGNLGIGTTTPLQKLTVSGNQYLTGAFFDGSYASGTAGMILQSTGTSTKWVESSSLGLGGSSQWISTSTGIYFNTGKIGIGTNSPSSLLSIEGSFSADSGRISSNGNGLFTVGESSTPQIFSLNGSSYLSMNSTNLSGLASGDWTTSFWLKPSQITLYTGLAIFNDDGVVITKSNKLGIIHGGSVAGCSTVVSVDTMVHVVAVKSGTNYNFYFNGALANGSFQSDTGYNLSSQYAIGSGFDGTKYTGLIGNILIYNRALTPSEVTNVYHDNYPSDGLVGNWSGNGNSLDSSNSSNNAVWNGVESYAPGYSNSVGNGSLVLNGRLNVTGVSTLDNGLVRTNGSGQIFVDGTGSSYYMGNLGIGTTTPLQKLTISGNQYLTGAFFDGSYASGTDGMILQSTGTSTKWVGTSTLGFVSSQWLSSGSDIYFNAGNIGIGTSSPLQRLDLVDATGVGALRLGSTSVSLAGSMRFNDNDFQGYDGDKWRSLTSLSSVSKERTGFPNRTDTSISFNSSTRTFVITGSNFKVYSEGVGYVKNTESIQISNTVGVHYIYYAPTTAVLTESMTSWGLTDGTVQIATIYWTGTEGLIGEERHGLTMDSMTHEYLHRTVGARYNSGFAGTFSSNPNFSVTGGSFYDEDIESSTSTTQTTLRILYRSGSNFVATATTTSYYLETANIIQYDNSGTLTDVGNNNFVAYWVFATNDPSTPIYGVVGQRQDTTLTNARANNTYESLSFGNVPFKEMKLLYRVIIKRSGVSELYQEAQDMRSVTTLSSGTYLASSHSALTGLTNDDHIQYALLSGRTGGQSLIGGVDANDALVFQGNGSATGNISTSTAIRFKVGDSGTTTALTILNNGNIGIGTTTSNYLLTLSGGAYSDGSTWSNASSRLLKENFTQLDRSDVLNKISQLEMTQWNYIGQTATMTHIGPIAEDFYSKFGLGGSDSSVSTIDPAGVALVGIQALNSGLSNLFGTTTLSSLIATSTVNYDSLSITDTFVALVEKAINKIFEAGKSLAGLITNKLTVGSHSQPAGITLYDEDTKDPYCLKMKSGVMTSVPGDCANQPTIQNTTPVAPVLETPNTSTVSTSETVSTTGPTTETSTSTTNVVSSTGTTSTPIVEIPVVVDPTPAEPVVVPDPIVAPVVIEPVSVPEIPVPDNVSGPEPVLAPTE